MSIEGSQLRQRIVKNFWPKLRRELTTEKVEEAAVDTKVSNSTSPAIFLASDSNETLQSKYYASDANLTVETMAPLSEYNGDDDFYFQMSHNPGILGLAFAKDDKPLPYMVPGGRFNEFFGWDSYFIALGLLQDGDVDMASNIATHFSYEIANYGKILNANRPYFLGRSQPPFLTDLAWKLHDHCEVSEFIDWMKAAIIEYKSVWIAPPRLEPETGLSRYLAQGRGIPPEVEPGHFDDVLKPYAAKHNLTIEQFSEQYNSQKLLEPDLDTFFEHDRSLRESGHDVTTRFINRSADLVTVDLTSLLYKYEVDIARAIEHYPSEFEGESARDWFCRASQRKHAADTYLWNPERGAYFDYNFKTRSTNYSWLWSATVFWTLWSGMASEYQAKQLVPNALSMLEFEGGLASTSKVENQGKQWDYPAGWAPHQILAWEGLERYGFHDDADRLATKWVNTTLRAANLSNGTIFEKYDVTGVPRPQDVLAEYGNQGSDETGFGWTNTAFVLAWDRYVKDKQ